MTEPKLQHEIIKAGNLRMHAVIQGEGPTVLLLHGFPESWYAWRHQLPALAEAGYRAVAVDMRGYGETDMPPDVSDYHVDRLCEDVDNLITALSDQPVHLVAHDWGGAVAWMFAAQYPDRLKSLAILNAPHPRAFHHHIRHNFKQIRRSWYMAFFQLPWLPEFLLRLDAQKIFAKAFRGASFRKEMFPDDVIDAFRLPMMRPGRLSAALNYYRALGRDLSNLERAKNFPDLSMPTMVIWAQNDIALGPELCDGIDQYFLGHFELHTIARCSHWVQQEQPEQVNKLLLDFLADREKDQ